MPHSPIGVRRVILVVLDGLRPDAIEAYNLANVRRLAAKGVSTMSGATVAPSVTAACMGSLLTGVPPEYHGLNSDRFHVPRRRDSVEPLPRVLAEASLPTTAFMCRVPLLMRWVARRLARRLGIGPAHLDGAGAVDVLGVALGPLERQREGLLLLHWPDCDDAGHEHGWMTPPYAAAARELDRALGMLVEWSGVLDDPSTLLIALADHGGGGEVLTNHDSPHALDRTIPIIIAGNVVAPGLLSQPTNLLDIPATVLWALGARLPSSYHGRPLTEAFGIVATPLMDGRRGATGRARVPRNAS